jgi:hypothetical protein
MIPKKRKTETPRDYLWENTSLCSDAIAIVLEYLKPYILRKDRKDRIDLSHYFLKWISEDRICIVRHDTDVSSSTYIKLKHQAQDVIPIFPEERLFLMRFFTGDGKEMPRIIENGGYYKFDKDSNSKYYGEFQDEFFMCFLDFKILLLYKGISNFVEVWTIDIFG